MHKVDLHISRFDEVTFDEVINNAGVYVLWTPSAQRRPSHIGEGWVMDRVGRHIKKFSDTVDGYFAPVTGPESRAKYDQEIGEAVLLLVGFMIDRYPPHNGNFGRGARIAALAGRHGVLRVCVSGRDPFAPPEAPPLRAARVIRIDLNALCRPQAAITDCTTHPWRRTG